MSAICVSFVSKHTRKDRSFHASIRRRSSALNFLKPSAKVITTVITGCCFFPLLFLFRISRAAFSDSSVVAYSSSLEYLSSFLIDFHESSAHRCRDDSSVSHVELILRFYCLYFLQDILVIKVAVYFFIFAVPDEPPPSTQDGPSVSNCLVFFDGNKKFF